MIAVLLANGFEEIEALTPVDVLRRAGADVRLVGMTDKVAVGAHGISVVCDMLPCEVELAGVEAVIFPGGMPGAVNLDKHEFTDKIISAVIKNGGHIGAICAAPLVLGRRGLLKGKRAVCYPGFEGELTGALIQSEPVVTDGNITTANGMPSSLAFAEELANIITGRKVFEAAKSGNAPHDIMEDEDAKLLSDTLKEFKIPAEIKGKIETGQFTRYEISVSSGICSAKIFDLQTDIELAFGRSGIRIDSHAGDEDPLSVAIEIPRKDRKALMLSDLLSRNEYKADNGKIPVCLGASTYGEMIFSTINELSHIAIGGATGMGKSVLINSILAGIIKNSSPCDVRLMLIDPKKIEFNMYCDSPFLLCPVLHEQDKCNTALQWVLGELGRRLEVCQRAGASSIDAYNKSAKERAELDISLPRIIIVIDELADVMRENQKADFLLSMIAHIGARLGIHLIISTCSPRDCVLTQSIMMFIPTRIAMRTISNAESVRILGKEGATRLTQNGDMLILMPNAEKIIRAQAPYISDASLEELLCEHKAGKAAAYSIDLMSALSGNSAEAKREAEGEFLDTLKNDSAFGKAIKIAVTERKISTSLLQRRLSIGFGKAAKFIDLMEDMGIVGPARGIAPREVLMTPEQFKEKLMEYGDF